MKPVHGLALPVLFYFSAEKRDFLIGGMRKKKAVWERYFLRIHSVGVGGGGLLMEGWQLV